MDGQLYRFAAVDPTFYDHPSRRRAQRKRPLTVDAGLDWDGWLRVEDGTWAHLHPPGIALPDQGWKIHLSATPDHAAQVVDVAARYCHAHGLAFKHLVDHATVAAQLSKDADRGSSAKLVTIYPTDEQDLHAALTDLDTALGHLPSPHILSDLRWHRGPAFVRYGAFSQARLRSEAGHRKYALLAPDGTLVEDRRTPYFAPPAWVTVPDFLQQQWDSLGDGAAPADFPYTVQSALAFSNAGGTYLGTDRQGVPVVLKEGRPFIGYSPDGRDAAQRVRDEHARLTDAAGPGIVPVRELAQVGDHVFLVLEHLGDVTLHSELIRRSPQIRSDSRPGDFVAYRDWAVAICDQVRVALTRLHAAGFTHGDLHPGNVMITPDSRAVLVDLEFSTPVRDDTPMQMGAPGFVPPDGRGGAAADLYALACIELAMFCPLTPLVALDREKIDDLLDHARRLYELPESWAEGIRTVIDPAPQSLRPPSQLGRAAQTALRAWDVDSEAGISEIAVMIGRSLDAAAPDFSRSDRLWPGDPAQFDENGIGLAHGAGGVIHAMREASLDVNPLALSWFRHATEAALAAADTNLGLYDGLAGAAWVHRRSGEHHLADAILHRLRGTPHDELGNDLYAGLPGVGLLFLSEANRDPGLLEDAARIAHTLRQRRAMLPKLTEHTPVTSRGAGLMWGASGTALFALRLFERTRESEYLRLAMDALDDDLLHCRTADDGSLQVDEGWRLMPYLASGSAGIGIVLAQLLLHLAPSEKYATALDGISRAASAPFTVQSGLFTGRSGLMLLHLTLARQGLATAVSRATLDAHAQALKLHAVRHAAGIGFAGDGLLRLSCDLATGSAGVLLALDAYGLLAHASDYPAQETLPLLLPTATVTASADSCAHSLGGR